MGDRENWTNRKFGNKSEPTENSEISECCRKLKNGHHFVNVNCTQKYQITNPPKVWVSSFLSVNRKRNISIGYYEKKWKITTIL